MTDQVNEQICGYCGRPLGEANEPREQCLDGCECDFHCDPEADAHARLTGHLCGWEVVA